MRVRGRKRPTGALGSYNTDNFPWVRIVQNANAYPAPYPFAANFGITAESRGNTETHGQRVDKHRVAVAKHEMLFLAGPSDRHGVGVWLACTESEESPSATSLS